MSIQKTFTACAVALAAVAYAGAAQAQAFNPNPPTFTDEDDKTTTNITNNNKYKNTNNNVANGGNATNSNSNENNSVHVSAPGLAGAVDGCMSVGGLSFGVGVSGFGASLGKTTATYNVDCAAVEAAKQGLNSGSTMNQALAGKVLEEVLPAYGAAGPAVRGELKVYFEKCGKLPESTEELVLGICPTKEEKKETAKKPSTTPTAQFVQVRRVNVDTAKPLQRPEQPKVVAPAATTPAAAPKAPTADSCNCIR